jgi:hypothetical protein
MHNRAKDRLSAEDDGARSAISFVAELTGELSSIARRHRFDALAYLLDMAKLEAENIRRDMHVKDN